MKRIFGEIDHIDEDECDASYEFTTKFPTTLKLIELFGNSFHDKIDTALAATLSTSEHEE